MTRLLVLILLNMSISACASNQYIVDIKEEWPSKYNFQFDPTGKYCEVYALFESPVYVLISHPGKIDAVSYYNSDTIIYSGGCKSPNSIRVLHINGDIESLNEIMLEELKELDSGYRD